MNDGYIFGKSDDEGTSIVLEFIFKEQIQFKTYIHIVVENSTGYPYI